jgi:hypothetical protein
MIAVNKFSTPTRVEAERALKSESGWGRSARIERDLRRCTRVTS